ncbi:copper resistance protein CopC, partial [Pseudomonas sp. GW704-F3]
MFRKTAFAVAMAASVFAATAVQAHPKLSSAT